MESKISTQLLTVSIVMPIRNEEAFIGRSLGAVLAQDYPHDRMEVIIADGMSDDGTRAEVMRLAADTDLRVLLLDNPSKTAAAALNVALQRVRGDVIVRVDGHCIIAQNYVSTCVKHLQEKQVDGVGGPIETIGTSFVSSAIAIAMSSWFGVGGSAFRTVTDREMIVDTVAFPAYTRAAIEATGPFDEELIRNQDDEYSFRLRKLGLRILLAPDVRSRYYSRTSISALWQQYFQYGYWKVRVMQKHPRQMSARQFVPPLFVGSVIGSLVATVITSRGRYIQWMAGIYTIFNLLVSAAIAWKHSWRHFAILPLIFSTLHLSYGLGFLVGLFKFRHRWRDQLSDLNGDTKMLPQE